MDSFVEKLQDPIVIVPYVILTIGILIIVIGYFKSSESSSSSSSSSFSVPDKIKDFFKIWFPYIIVIAGIIAGGFFI
jgi:hypothetical protein